MQKITERSSKMLRFTGRDQLPRSDSLLQELQKLVLKRRFFIYDVLTLIHFIVYAML